MKINKALATYPAAPVMIAFLPSRRPPRVVLAMLTSRANSSGNRDLGEIKQEDRTKI